MTPFRNLGTLKNTLETAKAFHIQKNTARYDYKMTWLGYTCPPGSKDWAFWNSPVSRVDDIL